MFDPSYPVEHLKPATYNPRLIDQEALDRLAYSIERLGMIKPIIVKDDLIIAGHQRTKALMRMGVTHAPAFLLGDGLSLADEIRFNQLHNGTDFDLGDENANVGPSNALGWDVSHTVTGNGKARGANIRSEISNLMLRYGNWGACVATQDGEVLHCGQYALACMIMQLPCRVYRIRDEIKAEAKELLAGQYGRFSYAHLTRNTYAQTFAQPFRLREGAKQARESYLYEDWVLPSLKGNERILDFGCGQGDYVKHLKKKGWDIRGVEFFFRKGNDIDTAAVHLMIRQLCAELPLKGRYDVVLADSVINSVDTNQAEADILDSMHALCRPGGTIWICGRSREQIDKASMARRRATVSGKAVEFLDEDGLTGIMHHGNWFYQKFHNKEQINALVWKHFPGCASMIHFDRQRFRFRIDKGVDIERERAVPALRREFNLMWPEGKSVNRADEIEAAYDAAISLERSRAA